MEIPDITSSRAEWLEADGLGGFASGTVSGIRTRRYHALLLCATTPPTGRLVLVNGFDASVETESGTFALSSQHYLPDVIHPDGASRLETFRPEPWPRWVFRLENGLRIEQNVLALRERPTVALWWKLAGKAGKAMLRVRPLLSGRDYHSLQRENAAFRFEPESRGRLLRWQPYQDVPGVLSVTNGTYRHEPTWYRHFVYEEERARGLDFVEDLAAPGALEWHLPRDEAIWILSAELPGGELTADGPSIEALLEEFRRVESARREAFPSRLHRSADQYLVGRGRGKTLIAGYPWFTDWGRDTFIAIRGIALAAGRLEEAGEILREWAGAVSEGMLPNRFPDRGEAPEFNSVDASLWYVIAVQDFLRALERSGGSVSGGERTILEGAVEAILDGYARGTRYGIRADDDGLIAAGEPGVQLTWMDAKVGDWVVTPRIGKPVEVQALWLNALHFASTWTPRFNDLYRRGRSAFETRFWNETAHSLYDVVDVDHERGRVDPSFRPNQIFAVGGLPLALLEGERARLVVEAVESRLLTPLGLRSLAPGEPGYRPRYQGGVVERDGSYHQGTVWPWLLGPFVEAWIRVRGGNARAKRQARERFFSPLLRHLDEAGLGHVSEIVDADGPHRPRGCPFQAWSVAEALRLELDVLGERRSRGRDAADTKRTHPASIPR